MGGRIVSGREGAPGQLEHTQGIYNFKSLLTTAETSRPVRTCHCHCHCHCQEEFDFIKKNLTRRMLCCAFCAVLSVLCCAVLSFVNYLNYLTLQYITIVFTIPHHCQEEFVYMKIGLSFVRKNLSTCKIVMESMATKGCPHIGLS